MLFVVVAHDKPDGLADRMAAREAHFEYARQTGCVRLGGPFLNAAGEMAGSRMIFEAEDIDAARTWHANDPYVRAGVFAESRVLPWKATFNPIEADL